MTQRDLIILGSSSQQPTRFRNHGAYLFRWEEEGLLFDPGEGTQRQFIFANVAPTCVTRIFISHFHGDHCLGLGSMLMRLNLDKVTHPIHCYYPKSQQVYFDRLRYSTIYHENIHVVEHPIAEDGIVDTEGPFIIEAYTLAHNVHCLGYRITEKDKLKFDKQKIEHFGLKSLEMKQIREQGFTTCHGQKITQEQICWTQHGESIAVIMDTKLCPQLTKIAHNARLLLCESTYLQAHEHLAKKHAHLTAAQAASIAKQADVKELVLTHFSARYLDLEDFYKEASTIFTPVHLAQDLKKIPLPRIETPSKKT